MAAPTMQPVKNLAFIKCNSMAEYNLLPDYLKGPDQFIVVDDSSNLQTAQSVAAQSPSSDINKSSD